MIINTDKIRVRKLDKSYVAIYGTQDHPYSSNYDLLTKDEARQMASSLEGIAERLTDEALRLRGMAQDLP